jgi:hypothetical protein
MVAFTILRMWQKGQSARTRMYLLVIFIVVLSAVTTLSLLTTLLAVGAFSPAQFPFCQSNPVPGAASEWQGLNRLRR